MTPNKSTPLPRFQYYRDPRRLWRQRLVLHQRLIHRHRRCHLLGLVDPYLPCHWLAAAISHSIPVLSEEGDLLDYQATVNQLTIQFLSEYEETRVEALKRLIMLHQKAPKKVH
jgi:hypothetical protein